MIERWITKKFMLGVFVLALAVLAIRLILNASGIPQPPVGTFVELMLLGAILLQESSHSVAQ